MNPNEYLRGLERRWRVVAACVLVALVVGLIFTRGDDQPQRVVRNYRATTYLINSSTLSSLSAAQRGPTNLQTIAALATLGEVPGRVAEEIGFQGDPSELTRNILVTADPATGLLSIAATAPAARPAIRLADAFATELMGFLEDRNLEFGQSLQDDVDELDEQIRELNREIEAANDDEEQRALVADRADLQLQQQTLNQQIASITGAGANSSGLDVIEPATARPVSADPGLLAPRSRVVLLLLAGLVGLILGVGIALLLERFDSRISTKEAAEEASNLPVLGEIPVIPRRRRSTVVAGAFPNSPASNAFRLLAAALLFGRRGLHAGTESNGNRSWRTILVTSPVKGEGKSTIVANLATAFAEAGKRVIVLSCDFRHPSLHHTFDLKQSPGLSEVLASGGAVDLEGALQETKVKGVRVLSTGRMPESTTGLFGSERMRHVLASARAQADIVLVDTGPILVASDWTQLLPEVEAVLVVARAGKTSAGAAERTAEILATLQAPIAGVVLNRLPRSVVDRQRHAFGYGGYGSLASDGGPTDAAAGDGELVGVAVEGEPRDAASSKDRPPDPDGGNPHLARPSRGA